jgi:predicted HicB family RNase H-like nuclease
MPRAKSDKSIIHAYLPPEAKSALKIEAVKQNITLEQLIEQILVQWIADKN